MLTIEYCDVEERVEIGKLFEEVGFADTAPPTDESGDSYVDNEWPIEVMSLDGYYAVQGMRWTALERQVLLKHRPFVDTMYKCKELRCSPEHLVLKQGTNPAWTRVGDLQKGDTIVTSEGISTVDSIEIVDSLDRLCDLQVDIAHSYFADDVLSHNSHFLTALGANALRAGRDVLHYTFELSEAAVGRRYDSNLCDINSNAIIENKDKVMSMYKEMDLGRLMIKEFPMNFATVYTLRNHIERLILKGFRPQLVIIDYADIMRSTRQFDSLRHELKLIYEELRGYATEMGFPIWTASQSNKEGSNSEIVDLGNMSEAYGKAMVADIVVSLSRRAFEKASGAGRLFIAKNRAGIDGIVYPVQIDTSKSKFVICGAPGALEAAAGENENDVKKALRNKWNELRNDPEFNKHVKSDDN